MVYPTLVSCLQFILISDLLFFFNLELLLPNRSCNKCLIYLFIFCFIRAVETYREAKVSKLSKYITGFSLELWWSFYNWKVPALFCYFNMYWTFHLYVLKSIIWICRKNVTFFLHVMCKAQRPKINSYNVLEVTSQLYTHC